jgi:probable rRNA maturation factor
MPSNGPAKLRENRFGRTRRAESGPLLFCEVIQSHWDKVVIFKKRIAGLSSSTLARFVLRVRCLLRLRGTVNVLVTGSAELRSLNRQFRGADKATDVLSFPSSSLSMKAGTARAAAGEIAISSDIARQKSERFGHSLANEVKILTLHGMLHLAGYDHERDDGEMARKEARLRRLMKLEASLIERTQSQPRRNKRRSA